MATRRLLSPAGFVLIAGAFLLPFVTVSCGGPAGTTGAATFTGTALVLGERPQLSISPEFRQRLEDQGAAEPAPLDDVRARYTTPIATQPFLLIVLILVGAGVLAAAVRGRWPRALAGGAIAVLAALFLVGGEVLAVRAAAERINTDMLPLTGAPRSAPNIGVAAIGYGFWLALAMVGLVAAVNTVDLIRASRRPEPDPPPLASPDQGPRQVTQS